MDAVNITKGAKLLRQRRRARKLSVAALARQLNVTNGAVSLWENGRRTPVGGTRQLMSDRLGIPVQTWEQAA